MPRIQPLSQNRADNMASMLLNAVEQKLGMVPNMISTMANSLTTTQAYLSFSQILAGGKLSDALREQIALAVSVANQCDYCVSAHSFLGGKAGLSETELLDARHGTSEDEKIHAALTFARKVVQDRGHVSDEDMAEIRFAGYSDGEITEIVANVVWNIFTNYFSRVADTEIDFPRVHSLAMSN
jgi:uncharacterized peroxidase-related enzyme